MRKLAFMAFAAAAAAASGCTSYVRVFDANNRQTGACIAKRDLLSFGMAHCEGHVYGSRVVKE